MTATPTERIAYVKENSHRLLTIPRSHTSPHLKHNTTDTPDINLRVITLLLRVDNLGRHPKDGALHRSIRSSEVDVVSPLRDTKVRNLADTRSLHKNIIGFEILDENKNRFQ